MLKLAGFDFNVLMLQRGINSANFFLVTSADMPRIDDLVETNLDQKCASTKTGAIGSDLMRLFTPYGSTWACAWSSESPEDGGRCAL